MQFDIGFGYQKPKKRKPFKTSTKKMEWNRSAGRDVLNFASTSKCRKCHRPLKWGDRSYEFDHKNSHEWDNRLENCWLVCRVCHGKATKIEKRKIKDRFLGTTIGYKTIKRKVSYKKPRKKTKHRKKRKRRTDIFAPIRIPKPKIRF